MTGTRLAGGLDPFVAWDGAGLVTAGDPRLAPGGRWPGWLRGPVGSVAFGDGGVRAVRDRLGQGKIFWARHRDEVLLASRPYHLVAEGIDFDRVRALPPGTVIDFDGAVQAVTTVDGWNFVLGPPATPSEIAVAITDELSRFLDALRCACPSVPAFVCLSGGIDSVSVAMMARAKFVDLRAVSFDLQGQPPSDDRLAARRVAADLGLELLEVDIAASELFDFLDDVLVDGIDWRPFNVHVGIVNAALAEAIRAATPTGDVLVLTGDLANELLADYTPEVYAGITQYALPQASPDALRRALVRGLESTHREVGVFGSRGLTVVQPYGVAADAYLRLDPAKIGAGGKGALAELVVGEPLPSYVRRRAKVRAQVGNASGGGVLAAFVEAGVDDSTLAARFAAIHGTDMKALRRFLTRAGTFRSGVPGDRDGR